LTKDDGKFEADGDKKLWRSNRAESSAVDGVLVLTTVKTTTTVKAARVLKAATTAKMEKTVKIPR